MLGWLDKATEERLGVDCYGKKSFVRYTALLSLYLSSWMMSLISVVHMRNMFPNLMHLNNLEHLTVIIPGR
jgi:hypothetical protein